MFDFPNSPTLNQEVTSPGGVTWIWDGTVWNIKRNVVIPDAPSDGGEYIRINNVWRKVRQRYDVGGTFTTTIPIPTWAKRVSLKSALYPSNTTSQYPLAQFGVGGTWFTTSGNYVINGFTNVASTSAVVSTYNLNGVGVLFHNGGTTPAAWYNTLELLLDRPNTSAVFGAECTGTVYGADVSKSFFSTYLGGGVTSALRLTDLRVNNSGGINWAAGSEILAEWSA